MFKFTAIVIALISATLFYVIFKEPPPLPRIPEVQWRDDTVQDTQIHPFSINVSDKVLDSLKQQLKSTTYVAPLKNVNFTYGFNSNQLQKIITYWEKTYQWRNREKLLNSVSHYRTKILGLNIHFIHIKQNPNTKSTKKVLPLLLLHGWPGSVKEFYGVFPLLSKAQEKYDFVFEIVAPSLPGYGFSDGAHYPGFGTAQIAQISKLLMERLGHKKFYVQGGDWGSLIGTDLATLYPESVIGFHNNMCPMPSTLKSYVQLFIGSFWPELYAEKAFQHRLYPLSSTFSYLMTETGYMHLQSTKPDTVGVALSNSPAGLAAYILEKFSTWMNYNYRDLPDGGFDPKSFEGRHYTLDDLLDNVMIYWTTNSITTSMRLYSENFNKERRSMNLESLPTVVPTVCAAYPYDLVYTPEAILRNKFTNLLYLSHMPRGGHFAAFEEPQLFAQDLWKAICNIENLVHDKPRNKCQ